MTSPVLALKLQWWRALAVELPEEDGGGRNSILVELLHISLYGTRDAASNFEKEVRKYMQSFGFKKRKEQFQHLFPRRERHPGNGSRRRLRVLRIQVCSCVVEYHP